jgi:hypothetical protein
MGPGEGSVGGGLALKLLAGLEAPDGTVLAGFGGCTGVEEMMGLLEGRWMRVMTN